MENSNAGALEKYTPRNLTNQTDFARELQSIDNNQTLTIMDKYKSKKQLMRAVYTAKQDEINHHLDSFQNYLLARKDVESKTIALEAQKAIMILEKDQLQLMKDIGLSHSDEISNTLIKAGTMLTEKLRQVEEAAIEPDIKKMTMENIRTVWTKTNMRIMENVDTYMDELQEREKNLKRL
ncbi:MAG: hypothetical protein L3J12_06710 [Spirochaetales bacterium]|nr:hypothetical protein [Spirochaetales bacterium]